MTSTDLVISEQQVTFSEQQLAVLKQIGVKDDVAASDLAIFFHQCKRTGLDPFAKQIYMIPRGGKQTIQTGIDGYRLIAERTGKYIGSDERVTRVGELLISATVTVKKAVSGYVGEFTATALYKEYAQKDSYGKPQGLWAKMPERMLIKCAEALALRKAFPQDLFGIITSEEMGQADNQELQALPRDTDPLVTEANIEKFKQKCLKAGFAWEKIFELAEAQVEGLRESQLPTLNEAFNVAKITPVEYTINGIPVTDPPITDAVTQAIDKHNQTVVERRDHNAAAVLDAGAKVVHATPAGDPITPAQIKTLAALCRGKEWDDAQRHEQASTFTKRVIGSFKELSKKEASDFIDHVKALGTE